MRLWNTIVIASAAAFVVGGLAKVGSAQMDEPAATTRPVESAAPPSKATPPKARPAKQLRLVQPWSKVTDLTDEQRQQLYDIHEDFKAKLKALEAEEEEKCNAVLTDAQKAQMAAAIEEEKAAKKAKAAEKKNGDAKPAD